MTPLLKQSCRPVLLEVGCGPGFYSSKLAKRFPQIDVIGLDPSEGLLARAKRKAARNHLTTVDSYARAPSNSPISPKPPISSLLRAFFSSFSTVVSPWKRSTPRLSQTACCSSPSRSLRFVPHCPLHACGFCSSSRVPGSRPRIFKIAAFSKGTVCRLCCVSTVEARPAMERSAISIRSLREARMSESPHAIIDPKRPCVLYHGRCALAVMAKAPKAGHVKTRLSPPLDSHQAAALNIAFLRDTLACLKEVAPPPQPTSSSHIVRSERKRTSPGLFQTTLLLIPQRGEGFGERLQYTAEDLFAAGFSAVCLIDSDSPTVPRALMLKPFNACSPMRTARCWVPPMTAGTTCLA